MRSFVSLVYSFSGTCAFSTSLSNEDRYTDSHTCTPIDLFCLWARFSVIYILIFFIISNFIVASLNLKLPISGWPYGILCIPAADFQGNKSKNSAVSYLFSTVLSYPTDALKHKLWKNRKEQFAHPNFKPLFIKLDVVLQNNLNKLWTQDQHFFRHTHFLASFQAQF